MRAPLLTVVLLLLTTAGRADQPPQACPPGHQHCPAAACPQYRSRDGMLIVTPQVARKLEHRDSAVPTVRTSELEQAAECCKAAAQRATPTCPVGSTSDVEQTCTAKKACCKGAGCDGVAGCAKSFERPDAIATDNEEKCTSGKCCKQGHCTAAATASDNCCEGTRGASVCCTKSTACATATDHTEEPCCRWSHCSVAAKVASGSYSQQQLAHLAEAAEHLTAAGLPDQATGVRELADKLRGQLIAHKSAQIEGLLAEIAEIKREDRLCTASSCCQNAATYETACEKACCKQGECAVAAADADAPCGKTTAEGDAGCEASRACQASTECGRQSHQESPTVAERLSHLAKAADYLQAAGCTEEAEHLHSLVNEARDRIIAEKVTHIEALQAEIAELQGKCTSKTCCASQGDSDSQCDQSSEDHQRAEASCPNEGDCKSHAAKAKCGSQVAIQVKVLQVPLSNLQSVDGELAATLGPGDDPTACQRVECDAADTLVQKLKETGAGEVLAWPTVVTKDGQTFDLKHPQSGAHLKVAFEKIGDHQLHVLVYPEPVEFDPQSELTAEQQARMREPYEIDTDFDFELGQTAIVGGHQYKRARTVKFVGPLTSKKVTTLEPMRTVFLINARPADESAVAAAADRKDDCGLSCPTIESAHSAPSHDELANDREQAREEMTKQLRAKVLSVLHSTGQIPPRSGECESDKPCAAPTPHCEVTSAPNVAHAIPTHESRKQVAISVKVVEVSLSKLKELGFAFAKFETGEGSFKPGSAPTLTDSNFASFLTALERENLAKSLSSSVMIVTEGRPGSLTTGGRVAVPVLRDDKTVGFKMQEISTHVDARATLLGANRVHLDIRPRLTQVDPSSDGSTPLNGTPKLCVRELDTSIDMEFGQSAVLGGLTQQRVILERRDAPREPSEVRDEVQTLFVVTPKLIESTSPVLPASHQQPAEATDRPAAAGGQFDFNHSYQVLPHPPLASPTGQPPFRAEVRTFVPFESIR